MFKSVTTHPTRVSYEKFSSLRCFCINLKCKNTDLLYTIAHYNNVIETWLAQLTSLFENLSGTCCSLKICLGLAAV